MVCALPVGKQSGLLQRDLEDVWERLLGIRKFDAAPISYNTALALIGESPDPTGLLLTCISDARKILEKQSEQLD